MKKIKSWLGEDVVYSTAYKVLNWMGLNLKRSKGKWGPTGRDLKRKIIYNNPVNVPEDQDRLIKALDRGDEEEIKGLLLLYREYYPEAFK